MKTLLTALAATLIASSAWAMTPDDIIDLCRAGFEPDKIARIVDAAGLDEPLTGADWARIKSEGCGDEVVDALLDVLVPVTESGVEEPSDVAAEDTDTDVDVYLSGSWGWHGYYGSLVWGYDPVWSAGWSWWDPWCGTGWVGWDPFWYDWWQWQHRPYRWAYWDPYYYGGDHYGGGHHGHRDADHRMYRRGGQSVTGYAAVKSSPAARRAAYVSARAKPYRGDRTVDATTSVYRTKTRVDGSAVHRATTTRSNTAYTTRPRSEVRSSAPGATVRSGQYGATKSKSSGTVTRRPGTAQGAYQGRTQVRTPSRAAPATRSQGTVTKKAHSGSTTGGTSAKSAPARDAGSKAAPSAPAPSGPSKAAARGGSSAPRRSR